jgi:Cobalamin biosynthesis protein CobN and related Mg-chelatases
MDTGKNASEYKWELVAVDRETNKIMSRHNCPPEAVGSIVEEIFKARQQGKMSEPDETIRERLKSLIDTKTISIELVHKLTKIELDWIERFLQGTETEGITTKSFISLLNIIQALSE